MSKVMALAKNYDPKKSLYPGIAQIKYDGVPVMFKKAGNHMLALSRQSEHMKSVEHIKELLGQVLENGDEVVMECLVKGETDFKNISGIIRRQVTDDRIFGKIFDGSARDSRNDPYVSRYEWMRDIANRCMRLSPTMKPVQIALGAYVQNETEFLEFYSRSARSYAEADTKYPNLGIRLEGIMLHHADKPYVVGKRLWGMSRYKPQPTIDLEVAGFEEAISEAGKPLGMVGRVNVRLVRQWLPQAAPEGWRAYPDGTASKVVGVGPGKLTHKDRTDLWAEYVNNDYTMQGVQIAEIKYMPDPSYHALRQATFQCWRPDKTEPDVLRY